MAVHIQYPAPSSVDVQTFTASTGALTTSVATSAAVLVSLDAPLTINTPTTKPALGAQLTYTFTQDSIGGNAPTFGSGFKSPNFLPRQGPGQVSSITFTLGADGFWHRTAVDGIDTTKPINVKDFGAVGDGVTNDRQAMQNWRLYFSNDPLWIANTTFTVGEIAINGRYTYFSTTAGTSAGSGGPTGVSSSIIDGTVVWKYLGNASQSVPGVGRSGTAYIPAGQYVTDDTIYYRGSFSQGVHWLGDGHYNGTGSTIGWAGADQTGKAIWKSLGECFSKYEGICFGDGRGGFQARPLASLWMDNQVGPP